VIRRSDGDDADAWIIVARLRERVAADFSYSGFDTRADTSATRMRVPLAIRMGQRARAGVVEARVEVSFWQSIYWVVWQVDD
jgi:hypothetical protein